jgi:uncharacterized membrane protein YgaE (UPF0421/DUF939 family)
MAWMTDRARRLRTRWAEASPRVLQASIAAGIAWALAQHLLGHERPAFAAIAAVVCLSPGIANRGRQAVALVAGVFVGGVLGVLTAHLLPGSALGIVAVTATAMMAAALYDITPVLIIQSGASAILVAAGSRLGPDASHLADAQIGLQRLGDAAIGAALGLLVSQILFTPDPARQVEDEACRLLSSLAAGLGRIAATLATRDEATARYALAQIRVAARHVGTLADASAQARRTASWSVRGRLARRRIRELVARYKHAPARLCAASLLYGEAVVRALANEPEPPPASIVVQARRVAAACAALGGEPPPADELRAFTPPPESAPSESMPPAWERCAGLAAVVEAVLDDLARPMASKESASPRRRVEA